MVRREFIGIVLIALTASTIVTLMLIGEVSEDRVEVLENKHPKGLGHDSRNTFSLALIAREPLTSVVIEVSALRELDTTTMEVEMGQFGREAMMELEPISTMMEMCNQIGVEPEEFEMEDVVRNKTTQDLYVFDFTDALADINGNVVSGYDDWGLTTVYAGFFNESGMSYLYGGVSDFFFMRNSTITELSVEFNDDKKVYKRLKELSPSEIASGVPDMLDAPPLGMVEFRDLEKDDTMRLAFSIDRSSVPNQDINEFRLLDGFELIEISCNGEIERRITNYYLKA